jgi:hypothetical protein
VNLSTLVKSRLATLGYGQKDLARAVEVTDSYISQLLTRRKAPPHRERTDIYPKMEAFLQLAPGELERLVEIERTEETRRRLGHAPEPLFRDFRDLVLRKCLPARRNAVRDVFEAQPFGTLERLVAQTLFRVVQRAARQELEDETWMRLTKRVGGRSHEELRVVVLDFLDTDVLQVSNDHCATFIDPFVESWDVDLDSLRLDIQLDSELVNDAHRTYAFVEQTPDQGVAAEPGLKAFLEGPQLAGALTEDEVQQLEAQRFGGRHPTKLYYYRALQNLRDVLHFDEG